MTTSNNTNRGEIIDVILSNTICATTTITNQMYIVGNGEASITVQCDKDGNTLSAYCKKGKKLIVFDNPVDADFVSKACKQRHAAQIRENNKINSFNRKFR